jgi:hypothetical protein
MKITNISKQNFKKQNFKGHMKIATHHDLPPRFVVQNASKILATSISMLPMLGYIWLCIHTIMKFVMPLGNGLLIRKILHHKQPLIIKFVA